jgi:hypothetical protein
MARKLSPLSKKRELGMNFPLSEGYFILVELQQGQKPSQENALLLPKIQVKSRIPKCHYSPPHPKIITKFLAIFIWQFSCCSLHPTSYTPK